MIFIGEKTSIMKCLRSLLLLAFKKCNTINMVFAGTVKGLVTPTTNAGWSRVISPNANKFCTTLSMWVTCCRSPWNAPKDRGTGPRCRPQITWSEAGAKELRATQPCRFFCSQISFRSTAWLMPHRSRWHEAPGKGSAPKHTAGKSKHPCILLPGCLQWLGL